MIRVWYDRRRECHVSNAAFIASKTLGVPAPLIAEWLAIWLMQEYPEIVDKAWVS